MIIDFHTHIFPPQIKAERERFLKTEPRFASMYASDKAGMATAEDLIESMDRDGVDISVALNFDWSDATLCRLTNEYIAASVRAFPDRLVGFGAIPADNPDRVNEEIERCAAAGLKGVGEVRFGRDFLKTGSNYLSGIMSNLKKHNLILLMHCSEPVGHVYPGKEDITPDFLYPFVSAFPDQPIVMAHWGGGLPFYELMPEVKRTLKNVYYDTAASPFLYKQDIYTAVSGITGAEKILFGTDSPLMPHKRVINEIRSSRLADKDKELILGQNAQKLIGIK